MHYVCLAHDDLLNRRRLCAQSVALAGATVFMSSVASGLRANLKVITCVSAVGSSLANSGCFLLVKLNTRPSRFSAARIFRYTDSDALFNTGCKFEAESRRRGSRCTMAGLSKCCDCDLTNVGLMGVSACNGVEAASVTSDESGVGGSSVISLSAHLRRRSSWRLFWNQICTAFSVMLTLWAISMRRALLGVDPATNSWLRMDNSCGEVLLLFLRANEALSMEGSWDGYVAGECEMKAKSRVGEALRLGRLMESLIDESASESMERSGLETSVETARRGFSALGKRNGVSESMEGNFGLSGVSWLRSSESGGSMRGVLTAGSEGLSGVVTNIVKNKECEGASEKRSAQCK